LAQLTNRLPDAPYVTPPISRRDFLVANSSALLAAQLRSALAAATPAESTSAAKLAKDGGPKAVRGKAGARVRWGAQEKLQLAAAIDQPSLFYWAGKAANKQTALFVERF
jgi:hypothetical protein